jgi:hypothetical protein
MNGINPGRKYKVTSKTGNNKIFVDNKVIQQLNVSKTNIIWLSDNISRLKRCGFI